MSFLLPLAAIAVLLCKLFRHPVILCGFVPQALRSEGADEATYRKTDLSSMSDRLDGIPSIPDSVRYDIYFFGCRHTPFSHRECKQNPLSGMQHHEIIYC